ncbi:MAG: response regulator transcription factor [Bdellovibrionota bacterium]
MKRILIVEDSVNSQNLLKLALGSDYSLTLSGLASQALIQLQNSTFDLIILDVSLPDGDGYQLCTRIRGQASSRKTPIFFLTSRAAVTDKVFAFSLGADDYLVKPFEPAELKARVDAKLQKTGQSESSDVVLKGMLKIHLGLQRAFLLDSPGEKDLRLTRIEFKLLVHLSSHENQIFTRDQLLDAIWGNGSEILDRTVDKHIHSLRKKLLRCSHYLHSVHGTGYQFTANENLKVA